MGPVKWFRKNKKQSVAILTILTVLSFVFVPIFLQILESRRGSKDPLVVSTKKYGDLRDSQLRFLLWQRERWNVFFQGFRQLVVSKGGKDIGSNSLRESEEEAVETWLLSRKAHEMGITTSKDTVNGLLSQWAQNRVTGIDSRAIANLAGSYNLSPSQLLDILGSELSALRVHRILRGDLGIMTGNMSPAQRWDYFLRLNRSARIEAVPIDVEKLVAQVPDPMAAEEKDLKALFEKYKEKLADPDSPEPGFREFHQIVVQYFKAEMRTFLDPREVTDEEILKYYNEHKEDKYTRLASQDFIKVLPEKPATIPNPKSEISNPKSEVPSPKSAGTKAEPGKPEAAKTQPAPATPDKPQTPNVPPEKAGAPAKTAPKTSSNEGRQLGLLRLVSVQQEKGKEEKTSKEVAAQPAKSEPAAAKPESAPAKPEPTTAAKPEPAAAKPEPAAAKPESTPAKPEPVPTKPEPTAAKPETAAAKPGSDATKTGETAPKTGAPAAKPEPPPRAKFEVVPLEKVKDEIRADLAKEKAKDKMAKAFEAVQKRMERFDQDTWIPYVQLTEKERKEKNIASAPEPPLEDLARIMKANRLVPGCTGWVSALDVAEWDIGNSIMEKFKREGTPFIERAFSQIPVYQAMTSEDRDGNLYLFWKLDDYSERVPEWADPGVRDRVVHAWKLDKARKLARDEAEAIAAKAREAAKPLKEVVATLGGTGVSPVQPNTGKMPVPPTAPVPPTVLTTGPFTWMVDPTMGGVYPFGKPHLGEVRETNGKPIPHLGDPFMARVFSTPQGGTNWAENLPQTIVYVVRVTEFNPLENTLWEEFLVTPFQAYRLAAIFDQGATDEAWKKELEAEAGLQWHREAARARVETDTESD